MSESASSVGKGSDRLEQSHRTFTVFARGERFVLSHTQISFDAPNHFTQAFLGEFEESSTRTLQLDVSPELFAIIVDYLSGYRILPLDPVALPRTMSVVRAMENITHDAEYLGLRRLHHTLVPPWTREHTVFTGTVDTIVQLDDVKMDNLTSGVHWDQEKGLVNRQGRPVVVRAKDKQVQVFQYGHVLTLHGQAPPVDPKPDRKTLYWSISDLPTDPPSTGVTDVFGIIQADCTFSIDSLGLVTAYELFDPNFETLPEHIRQTRFRLRSTERTLWADDVYFTITSRSTLKWDQLGERPYWNVRLLHLVARSKGVVRLSLFNSVEEQEQHPST